VVISLRLIEARALDSDPLKGLAQSFFAAIQGVLAAPWAVAESDFICEKTRGQRPSDFHQRLKFNSALRRVAAEDATVHQIISEVTYLTTLLSFTEGSIGVCSHSFPEGGRSPLWVKRRNTRSEHI
jgi:hypothetical protein